MRTEHFGQMDADGNSLVSAEELESFKAQMREQYQNDNAQNQRGKGQRGDKGGCRGKGNRIERLDNDGDGQISFSEFTANVPLFDKFDADNDGILTQEELSQGKRGRR
ncbi:calcium-binding EF-hand domain protein [Beggiatoa sp. PS]|nr:calcium-binding EF-hand domain protein [Beggiatoa sp. PS]